FLWSMGSTNNAIQNLSAGVYDLTVTDANGCIANAAYTVSQPSALNLTYNINSSSCGNNDGSITANPNGGSAPYSFLWSSNAGGQTGPTASNLGSGFYSCTITDNSGCIFTGSTAVVTTSAGPTLSFSTTPANGCSANAGGNIDLTPGGSSAYTFHWSNGATTEDLSSVAPGNYMVVVTGSNGCSSTGVASVQNGVANPGAELCILTVDSLTNTNKVIWEKPGSANGIKEYKIYREGSALNVYNHIKTLPFDSLSEYTDPIANPAVRAWRYKISHVDSCGNETPMSLHHKTIHLAANNGLGGVKNLAWDAYDGFSYGTFYIWRFHQSSGWVKLDSLPANLFSYTDVNPPGNGTLKYAIEVVRPTSCNSSRGIINTTRSNIKNIAAPMIGMEEYTFGAYNIFPNPTKNSFTIDLSVKETTKMFLRLLDVRGREVMLTQRVLSVGKNLELFNISELASGVYFIEAQVGEKMLRAKLVKED
ncbi:MAG: T9SS type A sorting domain-containing protein, partial [Bacteroidota bacterium]